LRGTYEIWHRRFCGARMRFFITPMTNSATDIGWPEAVGRLAGARSKAVTCAGLLKGHGDKEQISSGQLAYGEAKANFDAAIGGLVIALTEGSRPKSLPGLEADLENGSSALRSFCTTVNDLLPSSSGRKGVLTDIVTAAIEPVIKALAEAVATIYNNHRADDALTLETIKTQLEATKWPDFAEVKPAN
jgi:hypothetical protein